MTNEHSSRFTWRGRSYRKRKKHVNQHGWEVASDLRRKVSPCRKPWVHFDQLVTSFTSDKFKLEGAPPFQFLDDFFNALLESWIGNNDSSERLAVAGQHDLANGTGTKQAAPPVAQTDNIVFVATATDCGLCDHRSTPRSHKRMKYIGDFCRRCYSSRAKLLAFQEQRESDFLTCLVGSH